MRRFNLLFVDDDLAGVACGCCGRRFRHGDVARVIIAGAATVAYVAHHDCRDRAGDAVTH
jgi:hypothetical protein